MPGGSFQIWSGGDRMRNALGGSLSKDPAAGGSGQNWLELNIVGSTPIPTRAIERGIDTIADTRMHTLSLTLAGAPGYAAEYTRIGITLDGRNIGSEASTSPLDATIRLADANLPVRGRGRPADLAQCLGSHTLRRLEQRHDDRRHRARYFLPANVGYEDAPMQLPTIAATLRDDDGSEALSIDIAGLPVGATLSDGEHHFTASSLAQRLTISDWDLGELSITYRRQDWPLHADYRRHGLRAVEWQPGQHGQLRGSGAAGGRCDVDQRSSRQLRTAGGHGTRPECACSRARHRQAQA